MIMKLCYKMDPYRNRVNNLHDFVMDHSLGLSYGE